MSGWDACNGLVSFAGWLNSEGKPKPFWGPGPVFLTPYPQPQSIFVVSFDMGLLMFLERCVVSISNHECGRESHFDKYETLTQKVQGLFDLSEAKAQLL